MGLCYSKVGELLCEKCQFPTNTFDENTCMCQFGGFTVIPGDWKHVTEGPVDISYIEGTENIFLNCLVLHNPVLRMTVLAIYSDDVTVNKVIVSQTVYDEQCDPTFSHPRNILNYTVNSWSYIRGSSECTYGKIIWKHK
jgi:hypothetical protein